MARAGHVRPCAAAGDAGRARGRQQRKEVERQEAKREGNAMFETTLAGSLPKPSWLATPNVLWAPWTLTGAPLLEAKDDATALAIRRQEEAGLDIVSDGEQARQHFVHGFLAEVDGGEFARNVRMGIPNDRYAA